MNTGRKILNTKFLAILLLWVIFFPRFSNYLVTIPYIIPIRTVLRLGFYIVSFLFLILTPLFWNISKESQKFYLLIFAFRLVFLISDFFNGTDIDTIMVWVENTSWIMGTVVVICSLVKLHFSRTIRELYVLFLIITIINLIGMLVFSNGIAHSIMNGNNGLRQ